MASASTMLARRSAEAACPARQAPSITAVASASTICVVRRLPETSAMPEAACSTVVSSSQSGNKATQGMALRGLWPDVSARASASAATSPTPSNAAVHSP